MSTNISKSNINEISHSNTLPELIDSINNNNLSHYYPKSSNSLFKQCIDELNLVFYYKTEKILSNKEFSNANLIKFKDELFIILFTQISLYIKEIERLNEVIVNTTRVEKNIQDIKPNLIKQRAELVLDKKELIIPTIKSSFNSIETIIPFTLLDKRSIRNNTNDNKQLQNNDKQKIENKSKDAKNDLIETNFTSFSSNDNNTNSRVNDINGNDKDKDQDIGVSSFISSYKKKKTLSDHNPYPGMTGTNNITYIKNITPCVIKIHNNLKEVHKSPFINKINKIANYKIIKSVKDKIKAEEDSKMNNGNINMIDYSKINLSSININTSTNTKRSLINQLILYDTQISDLNQIEEMLKRIKDTALINSSKI